MKDFIDKLKVNEVIFSPFFNEQFSPLPELMATKLMGRNGDLVKKFSNIAKKHGFKDLKNIATGKSKHGDHTTVQHYYTDITEKGKIIETTIWFDANEFRMAMSCKPFIRDFPIGKGIKLDTNNPTKVVNELIKGFEKLLLEFKNMADKGEYSK